MADSDSPAVVGGCYCGLVQFQSKEPASGTTLCYCTICQTLHGAPFAPFTSIRKEHLQWTRTEGLISLAFSKIATRTICKKCRAPITMVYHADPEEIGIIASAIDEERSAAPIPKIKSHIYVGEKQSWYDILDNKPQFWGPSPRIQRWIEAATVALESQKDIQDDQVIRRG